MEFQPGDRVKVFTPVRKVGRSEKLLLRYFGPYVILERTSEVDYRVQRGLSKNSKADIIHVSRILPYHDRWSTPEMDPEELALEDFLRLIKEERIENANVCIKSGDIFSCPTDYSLAHAVSKDFNMEKGVALEFNNKFGNQDNLKKQNKEVGEVATLQVDNRVIYYLITKNRYYEKPTYLTLWKALHNLKDHCVINNNYVLAMPKIGCGLDKLRWEIVESMIKYIFLGTQVKIIIYIL